MVGTGGGCSETFDLSASAPCALLRTRADGTIEAANPEFLRWTGRSEDEVTGRLRFVDLLSEGARVFYEMHLLPRLRFSGTLEETAFHIQDPGNGRLDVLLTARIVDDGAAIVFALFPAGQRRRYERVQSGLRAAAETEANWLRQVEALGSIGAWSFAVGAQTLHWSPQVFHLHDLPVGEAPSLVDATAYLATDQMRRDWLRRLGRAAIEGTSFAIEVKIVSATGARKCVLLKGQPEWKDGRIVRVVGVARNLTEQRQAEAERDREKARILQLNANLPGVLLSFETDDAAGDLRITYVSPRCAALWGVTDEALYEDPALLDRLSGDGASTEILEALGNTADERLSGRFRLLSPEGGERWFELRGTVTRPAPGRRHGDCVFLDVTREVEAEAELSTMAAIARHAQKHESIGKLTGGVAHDFNNLLAVIMGNLELLREDIPEEEKDGCIEQALEAVERGSGLTRNMLAFARRARLAPKDFDLADVVRQTAGWAGRALPATIELDIDMPDGLPCVTADMDLTASALLNLLINARDAMPGGGQLRIGAEERHIGADDTGLALDGLNPGSYVVLTVADTGEGIPEADLSRVFEPFFTTKPPGSGSGLGLSMVYGFMRQTGGAVLVRSGREGGTAFDLYFPVERNAGAPGEAAAVPALPAAAEGYRILLVEDEAAVLSILGRTLETAGYRVTMARSGDEAATVFAQDRGFDLLLTDIVMPGALQGNDLAQALRSRQPDLPVVFMTGHASQTIFQTEGVRPDDSCLVKPIRRQELLDTVARVLATGAGAPDGCGHA